jgi:hypothetical protein
MKLTPQDILKAENEILDALARAHDRGKISHSEWTQAYLPTATRIAALRWVIAAREQGLDHE